MNIAPLLMFYIARSQSQIDGRMINYDIAQSLLFVVEKFYVHRSSSILFVLACERQHTMNFYKDLLEILFSRLDSAKAQIIVNDDDSASVRPGERVSNVLLVDSWESFLRIDPASKVLNYDINEYYHIFLQNRDMLLRRDIQMILNYCWKNHIINVNVQVQKSSGEIIVYSYFPYTNQHCGKVVPVVINRYHNGTMESDDLFPEKLINMFNCPLRVATWNFPPYVTLDHSKEGRDAIGGLEGNLLKQLGELMNFDIKIHVPPFNEVRGVIQGNHSSGAIGMLRRREVDLGIGSFWFLESRIRILTASHAYFQTPTVATLAISSWNYAPSRGTWFPVRWNLSLAFVVVFFMSLGLLYGLIRIKGARPNCSACLELIASGLGLPHSNELGRNSLRFFIMTWILFTLVIRAYYAGVLYDLIRNNFLRRAIPTPYEVVQLEYVFIMSKTSYNSFRYTSISSDTGLGHRVIDDQSNEGILRYIEEHPMEKLLAIAPLDFILDYILKNRKTDVLTIIKQPLMTQNYCIYFTKHSFLVDRVNVLLHHLSDVGLMDGWLKKSLDLSQLKSSGMAQRVSIGQREMKGIFYLCGLLWACSGVVFGLELISQRFKILRWIFMNL